MSSRSIKYFSSVEMILMMDLAGDTDYILFWNRVIPEREEIVAAARKLFSDGWITQEKERFVLTGQAECFRQMHDAVYAVFLEGLGDNPARIVVYPTGSQIYVLELLAQGAREVYRLQELADGELQEWLRERDILRASVISDEDIAEMLQEDEKNVLVQNCQPRIRFLRYNREGVMVREYILYDGMNGRYIRNSADLSLVPRLLTVQETEQLMKDCFEV